MKNSGVIVEWQLDGETKYGIARNNDQILIDQGKYMIRLSDRYGRVLTAGGKEINIIKKKGEIKIIGYLD